MYLRGLHSKDFKWLMSDGSPLVLFHYAGFEEGREEFISRHQQRYKASGEILDFLKDYTRKLKENK
jgi:hypothetical protein